jgi:hypothetical protein
MEMKIKTLPELESYLQAFNNLNIIRTWACNAIEIETTTFNAECIKASGIKIKHAFNQIDSYFVFLPE